MKLLTMQPYLATSHYFLPFKSKNIKCLLLYKHYEKHHIIEFIKKHTMKHSKVFIIPNYP